MRSLSFVAVAALLFCACGGTSSEQQDASVQEDASHQWDVSHPDGPPPQQDSGPVTCLTPSDYGTLGALEGFVTLGDDPTKYVSYIAALNSDTKPDLLWVELYGGYGALAGGIVPGTYQLTGAELAYDTCGVCVTITADYDMNTDQWKQDYMVTGGTLTITEVKPRVIGTLSNLTFTRATIDYQGGGATELHDDCTSAVGGGSFDAWYDVTAAFKIIGITDFHGQLDPIGPPTALKGGAAALSAYVAQERDSCTLVLSAGDLVGASPPLSSVYNEEPTIKAMNALGLTASTFGNHEFDKGIAALNTLVNLAEFDYTSSNLTNLTTEITGAVAPYAIYDFLDIRVAVVGVTDTDLVSVSNPANLGTLTVADQAGTITAVQNARTAAAAEGATVFVALMHAGANVGGTTGQLFDIANALTGFDVVLGGHSHIPDVSGTATSGAVILQPAIAGQSFARATLTVSTETGAVSARNGVIVPTVTASVTPDPDVVAILASYRTELATTMDPVAGQITAVFPQDGYTERLGESALGNLLADAMRATYSTQFAFINSGTLRAPFPSSYVPVASGLSRPPAAAPWDLVKGDIFSLLPFGNKAVTRTVTGTQLWEMLENGFGQLPAAKGRFPQISGFKVVYDPDGTVGSRVVSVTMPDGTTAIPKDATTYTITVIDFMNTGGDGYTMLDGSGTVQGFLTDVLFSYIDTQNTVTPTVDGRLTAQP